MICLIKTGTMTGNVTLTGLHERTVDNLESQEQFSGVADSPKFQDVGSKIGELVDKKQMAYGDSITKVGKLLRVFMSDYKNKDGTYTIPDKLIDYIGLMVRIIDKQNRVFSNPNGDRMMENPLKDICGYAMLGHELIAKNKNE